MTKIHSIHIEISGIVQGIGFRPAAARLAKKYNIYGWIANSSSGVEIAAEGEKYAVDAFIKQIITSPPKGGRIVSHKITDTSHQHFQSFTIRESISDTPKFTPVSPDIALCNECRDELLKHDNRRYRYPFITCTICGPRFSIHSNIPYDRKNTAMHPFSMCKVCLSEYEDINDIRFHSQSNSCNICGPYITMVDNNGIIVSGDPILNAVKSILDGKIVAIKGIGGFHLACDAKNDAAVGRLRERKGRGDKPFAVMARDIAAARDYVYMSPLEENLLNSPSAPVVISRKKDNSSIALSIAPNQRYLGVMLPYTPLHHLLFDIYEGLDPLDIIVMTSGNITDEPIVTSNTDAIAAFSKIADVIILHNRDIVNRCDDSVLFTVSDNDHPIFIRRSRGYVPSPLYSPVNLKNVLAFGSELKNTLSVASSRNILMSQHIGDLKHGKNLSFYEDTIKGLLSSAKITPEIGAYDLHPTMLSTNIAKNFIEKAGIKGVAIQHHHAHIAGCMIDNNIYDEPVIGVVFDGTGYGTDGNIWGMEFMTADYKGFNREGTLKYIPMPGGDAAAREPIRMGISFLYDAYGRDLLDLPLDILRRIDKNRLNILITMIENKINSPLTSSCGRLFDAVSSILGIRDIISYEAQGAIELEGIADEGCEKSYKLTIYKEDGMMKIFHKDMVIAMVTDLLSGRDKGEISAMFHNAIVSVSIDMCNMIREKSGIKKAALSGGGFQNRFLLSKIAGGLIKNGFICLTHKNIPMNDAGISAGQAVIASESI